MSTVLDDLNKQEYRESNESEGLNPLDLNLKRKTNVNNQQLNAVFLSIRKQLRYWSVVQLEELS